MNVNNMKRNFNNATIISENDFNELMFCNDEDMMNSSIKNVNIFWNNKLEEQKKFGETINKTVDNLDDGLKINNSLKLKEISSFEINNMENKTSLTSFKASEYLIVLNKMLDSYPTEKVNNNVKNENKTKDNIDELTINNIIKCSILMMLLKKFEN